jgi:hypothetical protein
MKKLSLDLGMLAVESFSTAPGAESRKGTVQGYATAGGAGCATDNVGTWCCWGTDTTCPGGGGDSYWCGSGKPGGGGTGQSCVGAGCSIDFCNTDDPHKCYDRI